MHSKSFFADRGPGSAGLYGFVTKKPLKAGRKRLHKAYQFLLNAEILLWERACSRRRRVS
ncbi:hypothetical protein EMIT093MI4_100161 [Pseudomonas sp. IT-93MI4]